MPNRTISRNPLPDRQHLTLVVREPPRNENIVGDAGSNMETNVYFLADRVQQPSSDHASTDIDNLRDIYESVDEPAVNAFLTRNMDTVALLADVHARVVEAFGVQTRVRLEAPSFDDGFLFVRIVGHGMGVDEAHDVMNSKIYPWLDGMDGETASRINITPEWYL